MSFRQHHFQMLVLGGVVGIPSNQFTVRLGHTLKSDGRTITSNAGTISSVVAFFYQPTSLILKFYYGRFSTKILTIDVKTCPFNTLPLVFACFKRNGIRITTSGGHQVGLPHATIFKANGINAWVRV